VNKTSNNLNKLPPKFDAKAIDKAKAVSKKDCVVSPEQHSGRSVMAEREQKQALCKKGITKLISWVHRQETSPEEIRNVQSEGILDSIEEE